MYRIISIPLLASLVIASGCARGGFGEDQRDCDGEVCLLDDFDGELDERWVGTTQAFQTYQGTLAISEPGVMLWLEPFGPNQEASFRLANMATGWYYRLILKSQNTNPTIGEALYVEIDANGGIHLHTGWNTGPSDRWVEDQWYTMATGDRFRVIAWQNGDIDLYRDDELLTTARVEDFPHHTKGGYVGIKIIGGASRGAIDEFRAGNVSPR